MDMRCMPENVKINKDKIEKIKRTLKMAYGVSDESAKRSFEINGKNSASCNYFSGEMNAYRNALVIINEIILLAESEGSN